MVPSFYEESSLQTETTWGTYRFGINKLPTTLHLHCSTGEFRSGIIRLDSSSPLPTESRIASFQPFLGNGIIRLGRRLHFTALSRDEKHPTHLDGRHPFTELLIRHKHFNLHHLGLRIILSELRAHFWILRARQAVKKALRSCLPCKLAHNPAGQELEAPLSADRVQRSTLFSGT